MNKKKLLLILKVCISVGLLVMLFSWIDIKEVGRLFGTLRLPFLLVAVAILLTQSAISSLKWKFILQADQGQASFLFLWKTYLVGGFIGLFLPTSFGGDVYRVFAIRHSAQDATRGAASVLFERLSGLFALVTLAFVGSLFLANSQLVWMMTILYLTSIVGILAFSSRSVVDKLRKRDSKLLSTIAKVLDTFIVYRKQPALLFVVLCISFWFQLNIVLVSKFHTLALGIDVPFTALLMVIPLVFLTEALPFSIHGLGIREGAFAFFFTLIGHTPEEGLAVALMVVTLKYLLGSVGGSLLLLDNLRSKSAEVRTPARAVEK